MLVAVGNGPSFGGGLRITEGALLDDGLLDVVIIKPMSKAGLIRTYPKLFKGTHVTHPQYEHHRVRSVTVAAPGIVSYADGERFGALPLTVECDTGSAEHPWLTTPPSTSPRGSARPRRTPPTAPAAATRCSPSSRATTASRSTTSRCRACHEIEAGRGVLVAAPTGSGKTIVGEFAIHLALATGRKAFYTTPIKALSNQKFHDLVTRYGEDQVGLLTGDNSINGEAPIVVMTTEVLRNMLYAGSRTLLGLGFVVMDEVHYLADRDRGAVWEEIIIHLPGVGRAGLAVGDRLQRRGVRRLAGDGAGRGHHDRGGEAAGAALPARHGGTPAARPVRRVGRRRGRRVRAGGRPGQPRAGADRARRLRQQPADARPALAAQGPAGVLQEPAPGRQRPAGLDPEPGRRDRPARPRGAAAGDRVRLQPGRLRRRGHPVPRRPTSG